jgi:hypothetical protein
MLSRVHLVAALLGLCLVGPAFAEDASATGPRAVPVDITALTIDSDFTVFMRKGVPEEARQAALRRLWVLLQLPVSCGELCDPSEPAAPSVAHVAGENLGIATH